MAAVVTREPKARYDLKLAQAKLWMSDTYTGWFVAGIDPVWSAGRLGHGEAPGERGGARR